MPKMENRICPRPGPAPLQPQECVSSRCPGRGTEVWEGCDRAGSELPHAGGRLAMRGGILVSRATGNQTRPEGAPLYERCLGEILSQRVLTAEGCGGEF